MYGLGRPPLVLAYAITLVTLLDAGVVRPSSAFPENSRFPNHRQQI
jgi:hypothetical protein